jgi:hypothetical protein
MSRSYDGRGIDLVAAKSIKLDWYDFAASVAPVAVLAALIG